MEVLREQFDGTFAPGGKPPGQPVGPGCFAGGQTGGAQSCAAGDPPGSQRSARGFGRLVRCSGWGDLSHPM